MFEWKKKKQDKRNQFDRSNWWILNNYSHTITAYKLSDFQKEVFVSTARNRWCTPRRMSESRALLKNIGTASLYSADK